MYMYVYDTADGRQSFGCSGLALRVAEALLVQVTLAASTYA
jgi:hypothetical protein